MAATSTTATAGGKGPATATPCRTRSSTSSVLSSASASASASSVLSTASASLSAAASTAISRGSTASTCSSASAVSGNNNVLLLRKLGLVAVAVLGVLCPAVRFSLTSPLQVASNASSGEGEGVVGVGLKGGVGNRDLNDADTAVNETQTVAVANDTDHRPYLDPHNGTSEYLDQVLAREGIVPRPFSAWDFDTNPQLPCFEGKHRNKDSESRKGFLFIKPMKASSTTGASITLRLAQQLGQTRGYDKPCRALTHHSSANQMGIAQLDKTETFLWSILRDPTKRTISEYFHFYVTRKSYPSDDTTFQNWLTEKNNYQDFFLKWLMETRPPKRRSVPNPAQIINGLLDRYSLLALTERMDESTVALQLLLGVNATDVLFLNSKTSGGYDDGKFRKTCFMIQKSFVSDGMQQYFDSPSYRRSVYYDELFYAAVNRSLDMTIDQVIGRERFQQALAEFKQTQKLVSESECASKVRYPCSSTGERQSQTDCVTGDWGCGFKCMDEVLAAQQTQQQSKAVAVEQ